MVSDSSPEMKVSNKHPIRFYIRSAMSFLKGTTGKDAEEGKDAIEPKPPVEQLKISALGNAINTAIACASRVEANDLGSIESIKTDYVEIDQGARKKFAPHILISIKRNPNAPTALDEKKLLADEADDAWTSSVVIV